jgi:hypothetical protein
MAFKVHPVNVRLFCCLVEKVEDSAHSKGFFSCFTGSPEIWMATSFTIVERRKGLVPVDWKEL